MSKIVLTLLAVIFIASFCQGAKILFFFGGGNYSHKNSAWAWAVELSNRGHNVTFLSAVSKQPTADTKIRDLSPKSLSSLLSETYDVDRFTLRKQGKDQEILNYFGPMSIKICQTVLQTDDPVLRPVIYNETFDLVVVNILFGECGYILANHYQAKTISYDATVPLAWFYDVFGFLPETAWIPDMVSKFKNFPLSYIDRVSNTFQSVFWHLDRLNNLHPPLEQLMKQAYNLEVAPSFIDLVRNTSMVFVNSHPAIDFAYPLPPMIQMIGGIGSWTQELPIPQKYQDFLDNSGLKGAVLISFGSTVDLEKVPVYYQQIFFNVVKKYEDVRFLMKWNGSFPEGFEGGLNNLMVTPWLPQRELLRHPKLRAFVTHGGLNSIQEATYYGVPLIVLPLFADQDYNSYRVESQSVGFQLEIRDLTFEIMDDAIHKILNNPKYKKNMEIKSEIFRDRPQSPLENIIYWTEFVLRHDDVSALKPMSTHLNWFQLRNLDVYLLVLIIVLSLLIFIGLVLKKIIKRVLVHNIKQRKRNSRKVKSS